MKIQNKFLSLPISVQFEITNNCNHRCPHCYIINNSNYHAFNKEDDSTIIEIAKRIVENKIFNVIITGGEPLMKKDLCKRLIIFFKGNDVSVSLNTNLTLLDDDFITFLEQNPINSILTSCPSADNFLYEEMVGVDKFDIFIDNLAKLNQHKIRTTVNMVINKKNLNDIFSTANILKEIGCTSFSATPMGFNVSNPQNDLYLNKEEVKLVINVLIQIKQELKLNVDIAEVIPKCLLDDNILLGNYNFINRKCSAGRTVAAISCDGNIRPCAHNVDSYGNILVEEFKTIWGRMGFWRANKLLPSECLNCGWLEKCNGGCRTNAKVYSGDWNGNDPWMTKSLPPIKHQSSFIELSENTVFNISQKIRHRKESDDAFFIINGTKNLFVNNELFEFISDLRQFETISMCDIAKRYNVDKENNSFKETIKYLISGNILEVN